MELIPSRTLFACLSGLFSLALGIFALAQDARSRLNRTYAFYMLTVAVLLMPATGAIESTFGHSPALFSYRAVQFALPLCSYFLICFLQEFGGSRNDKAAVVLRRSSQVVLIILAPLCLTSLVIEDFSVVRQGTDLIFKRQPGPLAPLSVLVSLFLPSAAAVTAVNRLRHSSGLKRKQMTLVAAGLAMGFLSTVVYFLSFTVADLPWVYHPLQMGMSFCFAYAMFKYQLFEFDLWLRRAAIYSGVYLTIASLPFFLLFPFRHVLPLGQPSLWIVLAGLMLVYGVCFALAPFLTTYLRHQSEKKKLAFLQEQLDAVRDSSEQLSDETGLTADEIGRRLLNSLRTFYWDRMNTPLRFVVVALVNGPEVSTASHPEMTVDATTLKRFVHSLAAVPARLLSEPFSSGNGADASELALAKRYLSENEIEVCVPCVHNGRFLGAILLGAKTRSFFWAEELNALRLVAAHVATAVRKSELLSHNKELQDLDRLKTELIHNITHEFKTPLQVVENAMEILMRDLSKGSLDPKKVSEYLLMVKNNAGLLAMFIQNLLEVSRIEQSKVDLKLRRAELNTVIQGAVDFIRPLADQKKLNIRFSHNGDLRLSIDVEKLQQVFCNLLSNAIKFTDEGTISVRAGAESGRAVIHITDTGRGLDPKYLELVFEKFFQVPAAENLQKEGTGLGLAIARGWVEAHGGSLKAVSRGLGTGTTFVVEIPLTAS